MCDSTLNEDTISTSTHGVKMSKDIASFIKGISFYILHQISGYYPNLSCPNNNQFKHIKNNHYYALVY